MMGLFFFMGQILGWLPPLIFTIMNEKGVNMRWGLGVVSFFCVFAVLMTLPMGNYQEAVEFAKRDSEAKFNEVFEKASRHESYVSHKASPRSSKRNSTKDSTELAPPESAEELETVKELSA